MKNEDKYIDKKHLVKFTFNVGMTFAFIGSLHPWFMWSLGYMYVILPALLIFLALFLSHTMQNPVFDNKNWILPTFALLFLMIYYNIVQQSNINAYIAISFNLLLFLSLFRINRDMLDKLMTFIAKTMAWLMLFSIFFFFLYLMGFPLPSNHADFNDMQYSYTNYYFFLLDDRSLFSIVPRFHSVFLEPSHLGVTTTLILMTQYGKWKKWYNVVLIVATLMTFSLEAYVLFAILIFTNLWVLGKKIFFKSIIAITLVASVVIISFYYNNGDNMINNLILLRLEVEDGELAGNNRVGISFDKEYENFSNSSDIIFGRAQSYDFSNEGNSGYKVYLYFYGLVGLFILILLHIFSVLDAKQYRLVVSAFIFIILDFIVRAYPLWYSVFVPFYCMAHSTYLDSLIKNKLIRQK